MASNPPYVPLPLVDGAKKRSIDGGIDGLDWARLVVRHARAMSADLALTIGSYTTPRAAVRLLNDSGYSVTSVTLAALQLGEHTRNNPERVLELEEQGEGPLLRCNGENYYLVVGLSCRFGGSGGASPGELLELLTVACHSESVDLNTLDGHSLSVPVRVLVLPDKHARHHH